MSTTLSNRNMICPLSVYLSMLLFRDITIPLQVDARKVDGILEKNQNLIGSILRWWGKNNVTRPLRCKYKSIPIDATDKIFNMMPAPEIKSFPCSGDSNSPLFYFKGVIQDGHLEGKGKLVFIDEAEWSKLHPLDVTRKKIMNATGFNVCFKISNFQGRGVKEIVGTFQNGSLHGLAKVTYLDNALSIGSYKNGKAHGYMRLFDANNTLQDAGGYNKGWVAGHHWKMRFGHLMYQDRDIIKDNVTPMIVFPVDENGSMQEPIAGDYFHKACALENIYKVQLIRILSSNSSCVLKIRYKLTDKQNYTYSLCSKSKYSVFGQNAYNPLCKINRGYEIDGSSTKLENWFQSINKLLDVQTIQDGYAVHSALEVLWQLRPDSEQLDEDVSTKLIADINLNVEEKTMTARVLDSAPVNIIFAAGGMKLDKALKLNGFNDIIIASEHRKIVPSDKTLGWSPTRILGYFDHGSLNGFTFLETNVKTYVWAMVKNGIMHGPCVIWGISYIIEPVRFTITAENSQTSDYIIILFDSPLIIFYTNFLYILGKITPSSF